MYCYHHELILCLYFLKFCCYNLVVGVSELRWKWRFIYYWNPIFLSISLSLWFPDWFWNGCTSKTKRVPSIHKIFHFVPLSSESWQEIGKMTSKLFYYPRPGVEPNDGDKWRQFHFTLQLCHKNVDGGKSFAGQIKHKIYET